MRGKLLVSTVALAITASLCVVADQQPVDGQVAESSLWIGSTPKIELIGDGWIPLAPFEGGAALNVSLRSRDEPVLGHVFESTPSFETKPVGAPEYEWGDMGGFVGGTAQGALWREFNRSSLNGHWEYSTTAPEQQVGGCSNPADRSTCSYSYQVSNFTEVLGLWYRPVFPLETSYLFGRLGSTFPGDTRNNIPSFVRYDLITGETTYVTTGPNASAGASQPLHVDVSADGRYVATGAGDTGRSLRFPNDAADYFPRIYDLETGEATHLGELLGYYVGDESAQVPQVDISNDGHILRFSSTSAALPGGDGATLRTWQLTVGTGPERDPLAYVALGDSYSAGEGTFQYNDSACHRGPLAWPTLLSDASSDVMLLLNYACTGARINHVLADDYKGNEPQIPEIPQPDVDLVTITIGGNNLGFGRILSDCVLPFVECLSGFGRSSWSRFERDADRLTDELETDLYPALAAAFPNARILHVGYPFLFPPHPEPTTGCGWLSDSEQQQLTSAAVRASEAIKLAADQHPRVEFVNALGILDGNELCTQESWVTTLIGPSWPIGTEQGHPIYPEGQEAYVALVQAALEG